MGTPEKGHCTSKFMNYVQNGSSLKAVYLRFLILPVSPHGDCQGYCSDGWKIIFDVTDRIIS